MPRAKEKYISIMENIKFQLVLSRAVVIRYNDAHSLDETLYLL